MQQAEFLRDLIRVGKKVFLTTPNRWFPVELHTALPFVHWLPQKMHQKILLLLGMDFYSKTENLNLLTKHLLKQFMSTVRTSTTFHYELYYHRLFMLPSNIMLFVDAP